MPGLGLGRDPERTPMQWTAARRTPASRAAGRGCRWRSATSVRTSRPSATTRARCSTLYRRLLALRRAEPALSIGSFAPVPGPGRLDRVRAGRHEGRRFLVALNLGHAPGLLSPRAPRLRRARRDRHRPGPRRRARRPAARAHRRRRRRRGARPREAEARVARTSVDARAGRVTSSATGKSRAPPRRAAASSPSGARRPGEDVAVAAGGSGSRLLAPQPPTGHFVLAPGQAVRAGAGPRRRRAPPPSPRTKLTRWSPPGAAGSRRGGTPRAGAPACAAPRCST